MQIANNPSFIFPHPPKMGNCATNAKIYAITDENEHTIGYRNTLASDYEGTYLDEEELNKIKSYNENKQHNNSFAYAEDIAKDNDRLQELMDEINNDLFYKRMGVMEV